MNKEPSRINNPFIQPSAPKTSTVQPSIQKNDTMRELAKKQLLDALEFSGDSLVQNIKFPSDTLNLEIENAVYLLFGKNSQDKGYREKIKRIVNRLKGNRNQHVREILKNGTLTVNDFCKMDDKTLNDDNYFKSGDKNTSKIIDKSKGGMRPPQLKNIPFKVIDLDAVEATLEKKENENTEEPLIHEKEHQEVHPAQLKSFDAEGNYHEDDETKTSKANDLKGCLDSEGNMDSHQGNDKGKENLFNTEFNPPQKNQVRHEKEQMSFIEKVGLENKTFEAPMEKENVNMNLYDDHLNKSFTSNSNSRILRELQDLVAKKNAAKEPNQKMENIETAKPQAEKDKQDIGSTLQICDSQVDTYTNTQQAVTHEESIDQPLQIPKSKNITTHINTNVNQFIQNKIEVINPSVLSQTTHISPSLTKNSPNINTSDIPLKSTEQNQVPIPNEFYNSCEEEIANHSLKIDTINIENETNFQNNDSTISPFAQEKKEVLHILSTSEHLISPKIQSHSKLNQIVKDNTDNSIKEKYKNLHESKLSLDTSLELVRNECHYYQNEISFMRDIISELRSKLSQVNEENYKWEVSQLKQNLHCKASELASKLKENQNLKLQLQKYEDSMSLMIKDNNTFRLETEKRFKQYQIEIEKMRASQLEVNTSQIAKNVNIEKEKRMHVTHKSEMPILPKEPNSITKTIEIFYPRVTIPQTIVQLQPIMKHVLPREEDYDYTNFTNGNGNPNIIEEAGRNNYLNMNGNMYDETKIDENRQGHGYYEESTNSQNINKYTNACGTAKNHPREGKKSNESKTGESGATNNIFNSVEDDTKRKREPPTKVEMKKEVNPRLHLFAEDPKNLFGTPERRSSPVTQKLKNNSQLVVGNNPKQEVSKSGNSSVNKKIAAPIQAEKTSQSALKELEADENLFQKDGSEKLFDIFGKKKISESEAKNSLFD